MEVETYSKIFDTVLSKVEWAQIPSEVQTKLEAFVEEKFDKILTSKALYESRKNDYEQSLKSLQEELDDYKIKYEESQKSYDSARQTINELESQVSTCMAELSKLQETSSGLENSTAEFRRQRDLVVDERDNLLKMLDRRNTEIERLQTDVVTITTQLNNAVNAKCEALAQQEEVASMKVSLEYKEKHFEQEKAFLNNQIQNLTEDLNRWAADIQNLRYEHTSKLILLESKLTKKTEELNIANENIASLTANNKVLIAKAEELNEKLMKQREVEIKLQESFDHELQAQTRLTELYKGLSDENSSQIEDLRKGVTELQELLRSASDQYGELETKYREAEIEHDEIVSKKNECIVLLKKELDSANELLKQVREDSLHREIENLSPHAATASKILKPNMSLTQLYTQYVTISEELLMEKEENRKLNAYIGKILQDLEEKTPLIQKDRRELDQSLETINQLTKQNNALLEECQKAQEECNDAKKMESRIYRENEKLKKEIVDLSRQVCFLLKEIEASRTVSSPSPDRDVSISDSLSSAEIISKKLVTFSDIQELQSNNQKLLALVRELSSKQEEAECMDAASIVSLKEKVNAMREKQSELLEEQSRQVKLLEKIKKQREMYKEMYERYAKIGANGDDDMQMDQSSYENSTAENSKIVSDPEKDKTIKELETKLAEQIKQFEQLKEEYETYKNEKCANEKIILDQLEELRKEHRELTQSNCKLSSLTEYHEERFKILKANTETYKSQITALEDKNKAYNTTIVKHEQSILHLKDEALNAQAKLSRAEVTLQNLQQEVHLLRDSETRLLKEREIMKREVQGQSLLLNNLEMIKASIERSEAEGKLRLESRFDDIMRECSALRRRLQEEQDKFRELSTHLERQTKSAQTKMEEEKSQADHLRNELNTMREELSTKNSQLEELSKKLKNSMLLSNSSGDNNKIRELEMQIKNSEEEITTLKQQLTILKDSAKQYCEIAENAEKEFKEEYEKNQKFRLETEAKIKKDAEELALLTERCGELEAELSIQTDGQHQNSIDLKNQLSKFKRELEVTTDELNVTKGHLESAKTEIKTLSESLGIAEDKYTREMVLHSSDLQALTSLKEEFTKITQELSQMRSEKEQAIEALNINKSSFEERGKMFESEKKEIENRLKDLEAQNNVLHDQIQELSTQLSLVHAQQVDNSLNASGADISMNRSLSEDEIKSSEQLLQIIKFLRREKDLAITKFEVLKAENTRLKSQQEIIEKDLAESKKSLAHEREDNEVSIVTAAKHSEVLRKVETLNAITDSNRILRDERDSLKAQLHELTVRSTALEEQLAPLQEKNRELSAKAETALTENVALRAEATRWRQRANVLIEKANKVSPEDWRRLQQEKESLQKLLGVEKEAHRRLIDESNVIRQEKNKLEEACNNLTIQNRNKMTEVKKLTDELSNIKQQVSRLSQELIEAREIAQLRTEENTKISEDLASKDVQLFDMRAKETQVRKIAKKYKTQFEELERLRKEEQKQNEEKDKIQPEVSAEMQEIYRNEGRAELEQKINEIEKSYNEQISTLNEQIVKIQSEMEQLKKDNVTLRNNDSEKDERTKLVLKAAKVKITDLTEERNKLKKELTDLKVRFESIEQNKDGERISQLEREKNEVVTEKQQDRDRYQREIESLTQRVNQLQRQLGLPPASKPSTSSGSSDKSGSEPPTANIKPMSGHSNLQTQQSATVMPWRGGETPFASIRPMAQLRTVAVLPTSQNTGNSSSSTAVLVPPQQQLVHTTGNSSIEVMSSSPTSSHTDYMPATSSASPAVAPIRQVVVPPTQQATIGMSSREEPPSAAESTQDMENDNQQPVMQQQQQAVAMVLPRVEQQSTSSSSSQQQNVEQSTSISTPVVASSQQASSSNTVTTTQAASGHKRPRETEGDSSTGGQNDDQSKIQPQLKRTRTQGASQEVFQGVTESGVEVEYQVPTSSQRDQEDEVIVLSDNDAEDHDGVDEGEGPDEGEGDGIEGANEDPDDGGPFDESGDGDGESYEMAYEPEQELNYDDADCNDMDSSEPPTDDPNNEVEIIEDSCGEVPNQSGAAAISADASNQASQSNVGGSSESVQGPSGQTGAPQSEAISSGSEGTSGITLSQAAPSLTLFSRNRNITPLNRQQQQSHLLLPHGFEEIGDDGIVPSTPTLYVPRRTDGFGEAVSSPHVPSGRFTFNESVSVPGGSRLSSVLGQNEGIDDSRGDVPQLDDSGTGRSVPSTPLQVSPQGEQISGESNAEIAPSVEQMSETSQSQGRGDVEGEVESECPPSQPGPSGDAQSRGESVDVQDENEDLIEVEEGTDGVSSEGEKQQTVEDCEVEEGREAEASESPSSNTRSRGQSPRGTGTARRSSRVTFRGRVNHRPIIWTDRQSSSQPASPAETGRNRGMTVTESRGNYSTRHNRGRRMRQPRTPFGNRF